jgi:hypothetical protein
MTSAVAQQPPRITIPTDWVWEIARQVERSHADFRVGAFQNMGGPSKSAAARRNAHMTDLLLFMPLLRTGDHNEQYDEMWAALRAGHLVVTLGGPRKPDVRECYICTRKSQVVIAKRHPRDTRVFPICLSEDDCITIRPV